MKRKIIKYIAIIFACLLVSIIIEHTIVYFILNNGEKHRISLIKKMSFNGIIIAYFYSEQEKGYDYYSDNDDLFFGKYFFKNNRLLNLQEGDSVSKLKGELILDIYRKDRHGKYQYIGRSQ